MTFEPLDAIETRVLGCLIEKELTTPDYYPLSLNALVNACNQLSNREPVMTLSESDVNRALDKLRDKRLAVVIAGGDSRVLKFAHRATELFGLQRPELALLCVLLLRGPQTAGELRSRTGRMHEFADLADLTAVLAGLAARPEPQPALVAVLPRQPGAKEPRHTHLLGGTPAAPAITPEPAAFTAALSADTIRLSELEKTCADLQQQLADLRREFAEFRAKFE